MFLLFTPDLFEVMISALAHLWHPADTQPGVEKSKLKSLLHGTVTLNFTSPFHNLLSALQFSVHQNH
jgi:hypothetical protein